MSKKFAREMTMYEIAYTTVDGDESTLVSIAAPSFKAAMAEALKRLDVELAALTVEAAGLVAVVE